MACIRCLKLSYKERLIGDVNVFKRKLDNFLSQVPDDPCETNSDNSIAGAALRQSWCLQRDGLAD